MTTTRPAPSLPALPPLTRFRWQNPISYAAYAPVLNCAYRYAAQHMLTAICASKPTGQRAPQLLARHIVMAHLHDTLPRDHAFHRHPTPTSWMRSISLA